LQDGQLRGSIKLTLPSPFAERGFADDLVALFAAHPDLRIEAKVSDRPVDVIEQSLDVAFFLSDQPDRHPGSTVVGLAPSSLAAAPSYLDRVGRPHTPDQLAGHRTVRVSSRRGNPIPWSLQRVDGAQVEVPAIGSFLVSDSLTQTYNAVRCGAGIARLPLAYIAAQVDQRTLDLVLSDWSCKPVFVLADVRPRIAGSNKLKTLLAVARSWLQRYHAMAAGTTLERYYQARLRADLVEWPSLSEMYEETRGRVEPL
jgi:DNA-binding transcriptional LysR family regulator